MNRQFYFTCGLVLVCIVLVFSSCTSDSASTNEAGNPDAEAVVTLVNDGARAYLITSITGEGAEAPVGSSNPELTLIAGRRYMFINNAGASSHPLDFRDVNRNKLLGQSNAAGSFASDEEVNVVRNGDSITFTLTAELAEAIADYICAFHPGMNGAIVVANG